MASLTSRDERLQELSEALKGRDAIIDKQQDTMEKLVQRVETLTNAAVPPVVNMDAGAVVNRGPPAKSPEDIHKEKILNVYQNLQKCSDIKSYRHSIQLNVREWLRMIDSRMGILATAVDLKTANIKDAEYVNLIKSKLDFAVIQELDLKFAAKSPDPYQWDSISKENLCKLLIEQFGQKEPDVAALLKCFGANRYKKAADVDVRNHYCRWWEQIPLCLKPSDAAGREKFVDLVLRTLFYFSLDDHDIQKKLSDIPELEQTLLKFYETAILAESQRSHYQDTNEKASILDASSAISVNKFEGKSFSGNSCQCNFRQGCGGKQQQQQEQQQQHDDATQHQQAKVKQNDIQNASSINNDYAKKKQQYYNDNKNSKFKESRLHVTIVDKLVTVSIGVKNVSL